jgi:hypothetical protein
MTALTNNRLLINEPVMVLLSPALPAIILWYGLAQGEGRRRGPAPERWVRIKKIGKNQGDFSFFRVSRNIAAMTTSTSTTPARTIHEGMDAPCCWPPDGGMMYGVTG